MVLRNLAIWAAALILAGFQPACAAMGDIVELQPQPTPMGYVLFCLKNQSQCAPAGSTHRITLNDKTWQILVSVNHKINAHIAPDAAKGAFDWSLNTTLGNCNDYAVQKRQALLARGFPIAALSLASVVTEQNEGHLVLAVRTDRGTYLMDNRTELLKNWRESGYRFVSMQSEHNPNQWVKIKPATTEEALLK